MHQLAIDRISNDSQRLLGNFLGITAHARILTVSTVVLVSSRRENASRDCVTDGLQNGIALLQF